MRRFFPRAVLGAALALSAAACAAGTATSGSSGGAGGRYQVLIPDPAVVGGASAADAERVGNLLRSQVADMLRHTSVDAGAMRNAMRQYGVESLDSTTARQLASQMGVQNVLYVVMRSGGAGIQADAQFVDVASGDVLRIPDVGGANANEVAGAVYSGVERVIEGVTLAGACNDYLSSQNYTQALTTCDSALEVVPGSSAALYGKATSLLHLERYDEALTSYQQLLASENANQEALLGAGLAASNLGRSSDALGFYNRYLQLDPGNVQVRMTVAGEIATTGDFVSAYEVLIPVAEDPEYRDDGEFQRFLFSLATAAGTRVSNEQGADAARPYYETALDAYGRAFSGEEQPDVGQIRQAVAVNLGLGRTDDALRMAREATVQHDTVAAVWSQYASALSEVEQYAEAVQAFTRVIDLDPDFENVYIRRALARLEAGQRQQALADLEQAAQRGSQDQVAQVLYREGGAALQANRYADAVSLLEQARRYASGSLASDISFFQGFALFQQGVEIARANGSGAVAPARQAVGFFQRARPLVEGGTNAQKQEVLSAIDQYVANQEAIIRAGS